MNRFCADVPAESVNDSRYREPIIQALKNACSHNGCIYLDHEIINHPSDRGKKLFRAIYQKAAS